jgi:hypothetical protein
LHGFEINKPKRGYVDASGEAVPPEEGDLRVPLPFIPRAPRADRRKGRLLLKRLMWIHRILGSDIFLSELRLS